MGAKAGSDARTDRGLDHDRRATVVAEYQIALEPRRFKDQLLMLEGVLRSLDPDVRGPIRVLCGQLIARWLALEGPVGSMILRISAFSSGVRADISAEPDPHGYAFWEALVTPHIEGLASRWGMDRRSSGVWFEIEPETR